MGDARLVVRERNRGARVRRVTPEEAVKILEARATVELLAAGYAALRRRRSARLNSRLVRFPDRPGPEAPAGGERNAAETGDASPPSDVAQTPLVVATGQRAA